MTGNHRNDGETFIQRSISQRVDGPTAIKTCRGLGHLTIPIDSYERVLHSILKLHSESDEKIKTRWWWATPHPSTCHSILRKGEKNAQQAYLRTQRSEQHKQQSLAFDIRSKVKEFNQHLPPVDMDVTHAYIFKRENQGTTDPTLRHKIEHDYQV
jgi:hypothetical protein